MELTGGRKQKTEKCKKHKLAFIMYRCFVAIFINFFEILKFISTEYFIEL